jgi:cystathionine gamma-synthase
MSVENRLALGITPQLIRFSVGLEDKDDLWADIEAAVAAANEN